MIRFDRSRLLDHPDAAVRARRSLALDLAEAALGAIDPERCARAAIARLRARGEDLDGATLFSFGKAAVPMARAASESLRLHGGIVVAPVLEVIHGLDVRLGGHPDPAGDAEQTGAEVLRRAQALGPGDVALCLVSGGASAMLELPRDGVSVPDIADLARRLMHAGAGIAELNAVRCALSRLKGGKLARAMGRAHVVTIVLSDVPGHGPELVASGPTMAVPTDAPEARVVLERYGLFEGLSEAVRSAVLAPFEPLSIRGVIEIAADHETARRAVVERARARGIAVRDRDGVFSGEAHALGAMLAREPCEHAWVWGGETTVTVRGPGRGGRNQELVLTALAGDLPDGLLLSLATDGVDGSSDAAGAIVDAAAIEDARRLGLDPRRALADNDSHAFFDALGTALRTGPTGTNVADILLRLP